MYKVAIDIDTNAVCSFLSSLVSSKLNKRWKASFVILGLCPIISVKRLLLDKGATIPPR